MSFISLFAGIGGFDLGLERAGLRCMAQVEWDAAATSVLARHYPNVQRFGDVKDVGKRNLPAVDVIVGGFPCQDVSVAGKRAGLVGERSGQWFEFHRILSELKPRFAVIENVPGLLSSNGGRDFAEILRGLEECGYRVAWRTLDAQYFGVAQRRRRVFIVASLGDGSCAEILFEREGSTGDIEQGIEEREGTTEPAIAGTLSSSGAGTARTGNARSEADMLVAIDLQQVTSVANRSTPTHETPPLTPQSSIIAFSAGQSEKAGSIAASERLSPTLKGASSGTNQVPAIAIRSSNTSSNGWGVLQDGTTHTLGGSSDVIAYGIQTANTNMLGPLHKANQAWTVEPNPTRTAIAGTVGVRRLTPTECERLQGFPDGWTTGQSDSTRYRQLGNAVCVNVSEWLGRRIVKVIGAAS